MFTIGSIVEWSSQSGGYVKKKSGEVVAIVPAGEWTAKYVEKCGLKGNSTLGYGFPRNHDSYLIKIGNKAYWPRVKNLKLVQQTL